MNPKVVGISFGITWGLLTLFIGLTSAFFDYGTAWVKLFSSFYISYASFVVGTLIGGLWGLADGLIDGAIFAVLYNFVQRVFYQVERYKVRL